MSCDTAGRSAQLSGQGEGGRERERERERDLGVVDRDEAVKQHPNVDAGECDRLHELPFCAEFVPSKADRESG